MSKSSQSSSKLHLNKELRVLGIDDSHFEQGDDTCLIIGALYRSSHGQNGYVESVLSTNIEIDGEDATQKLAELVNSSKSRPNAIMLQGITFAGFNVVDIVEISKLTNLPVITIMRRKPNYEEIKSALQNLSEPETRWNKIQAAGKVHKAGKIFYQAAGTGTDNAVQFINATTVHGNMPEPVRLAHVIASGVILGSPHTRA